MKVLFAVSNEEISESIVKRYQREYKEIISYKNVYFSEKCVKMIFGPQKVIQNYGNEV